MISGNLMMLVKRKEEVRGVGGATRRPSAPMYLFCFSEINGDVRNLAK